LPVTLVKAVKQSRTSVWLSIFPFTLCIYITIIQNDEGGNAKVKVVTLKLCSRIYEDEKQVQAFFRDIY
jgi:hypothetical protein